MSWGFRRKVLVEMPIGNVEEAQERRRCARPRNGFPGSFVELERGIKLDDAYRLPRLER